MFRCRQKFQLSGCHPIIVTDEKLLDSGVIEVSHVDISERVLPPPENFDLDLMLKAGVPLKQVNCKVITPTSAFLPDAEPVEPTEPSNNKEN